MQKVINNLVQLQELLEARLQQETLSPGNRLQELDASIKAMMESLPPDLGPRFERLHHRQHQAIVPIANGICTGCGIQLPVSLVHTVRALKDIHPCPNCARFLYTTDASGTPRPQRPRRAPGPAPTGIARFSSPALMVPDMQAQTRDEAIRLLCERMVEKGFAENADTLLEQALRREAIVPTAIENGLAFPHVRSADGGGLTLALGVCRDGVEFHSDLGPVTRILVFVTIPGAASAFYLRLLAGLVKSFGTEVARQKLIKAETPEALWKALTQTTRKHIV